jgi:RNA polymerase sigma-70 factor (ECF subfamily)
MDAALPSGLTARDQEVTLAERHRYGDEKAFEEVYARYGPMIHNLSLRMAGDSSDAADLTQEIFLRVYRHLGKFKGRSSLKTWIFRVGLNCCRSRLRRRSLLRARFPEADVRQLDNVEDLSRSPESRAMAADSASQVTAALARLPLVYREAVVLRDIQGLSYLEIAEVAGVRVGTVRSRIARGRLRLREFLEATP